MMKSKIRAMAMVLPAALLAVGLVACSGSAAPRKVDEAAQAANVAKFVECLNNAGQTAKVLDSGQVGVKLVEGAGGGQTSAGDGAVTLTSGPDGSWMAAQSAKGYPKEGGTRAAWTDCQTKIPDFTQPKPTKVPGEVTSSAKLSSVSAEDVSKASLAFAKCARQNNYADFADPNDRGELTFPAGLTEDQFRSLITACKSHVTEIGLPIAKKSTDAFTFDWAAVMTDVFGTAPTTIIGGSE